jgi:hypothetical protein
MSVIGAFPLLSDLKRRTIRADVNPLDKSTIVSIYPKRIHEIKPTIQPGVFRIEPGTFEHPAILVVGPSSWWKEIDENQPLLEIPQGSIQIAASVVNDYCNGVLGCDMGEHMPGMFYIPGEWTVERIQRERSGELANASRKQRNWFELLVRMADTMWARTNGNPLTISDDMRLAARELNLVNKDWLRDSFALELVRCKACGHLANPEYPVCPNCKAITDPVKAKELNLTFIT